MRFEIPIILLSSWGVLSSFDVCHRFCQETVDPSSYCKIDMSPRLCHGSDIPCCSPEPAIARVRAAAAATTATFVPSPTTSAPLRTRECEAYPSTPTSPMFLWVEGTKLDTFADYESMFGRLAAYITSNCANMQTTRLIVRVGSPFTHATSDSRSLFWPPESSPLLTVLARQLRRAGVSQPIRILFYPYIYETDSRTEWIRFARDRSINPRSNIKVTDRNVYDGVYSFVNGWQSVVNSDPSLPIEIEGYTIDHEELLPTKIRGDLHFVPFTSADLRPYKRAYPSIKTGVSFGYDDRSKIEEYGEYFDFLFLQVYDLYYPHKHADKNKDKSIFVKHVSNPTKLADVILEHVLDETIQRLYRARTDKVFLMWSTQYTSETRCLYPVGNEKTCGINYEIHSKPEDFNTFIRYLTSQSSVLSRMQHGIYTFNFLQQSWLPRSQRR